MSSAGMKFNKKHAQEMAEKGEKEQKEAGRFPKKISPIRKCEVSDGNWSPEENEGENLRSFLRAGTRFECLTTPDNFL